MMQTKIASLILRKPFLQSHPPIDILDLGLGSAVFAAERKEAL